MDSMRRVKLGDVARVEISGVDKKMTAGETSVRLCNFTDVYKYWAITTPMYDSFMVASANEREIEKFTLHRGQVAVTKDSETRDDIGIPTYIADSFDDVLLGYHCALITPDESQLDGKYLNAFLHTEFIQKFFSANASGSGQRYTLSIETLNSIPLYLPSLAEQERIGSIFSSIDRKIEVNRQINDYLEAMSRQLYDFWFVQFDFPDSNGKPYKSSGGKMVWNKKLKRDIPEGWLNGQLIDIANITMGQSPDGTSYNSEGNGVLFYQGSTDFGIRFPSVRQYTTAPTRFAKKGDILMSVRAPVGAMNIANNDCCIGRGLAALNPKMGSTTHLYYIIQDFKAAFDNRNSVGTTFGSITKDELHSMPVIFPDKKTIALFESICKPFFDKQMLIGKEIIELTSERECLLPILMNGQASLCR